MMDATQGALDMNRRIRTAATAAACVVALAFAAPGWAQVSTGRIDVTIEDSTGARLPGANLQLDGPVALTQLADQAGQTHFLNLPVGTYTIKATLPGFTPATSSN